MAGQCAPLGHIRLIAGHSLVPQTGILVYGGGPGGDGVAEDPGSVVFLLLDKVLEEMDSLELNAQLEAVTAEKQDILDQMQALEEDKSRRSLRTSRQREMEAWLEQQPLCFTEYDDTITHKFIERITVVDAATIRIKMKDIDVVISEGLC